jgi:predicted nucleic-acid-binding protein
VSIAVDTNVLVRYLTWDDTAQAEAAAAAIEGADGVTVSTIVLCELAWVLKRAYRYGSREIAGAIQQIIESRNVEVDRPAAAIGLRLLQDGGDFADGVIQSDANRAHCRYVVTFDQNFARLAGPGRCVLLGAEPGR